MWLKAKRTHHQWPALKEILNEVLQAKGVIASENLGQKREVKNDEDGKYVGKYKRYILSYL